MSVDECPMCAGLAAVQVQVQRPEGWRCIKCDHLAAPDEKPADTVESLRAAVARLTAERDEAKANFLRCAQAIGVSYEADGHASAPGPIDEVERYIREAVAERMDGIDRVVAAEEAILRQVAELAEAHGDRSAKNVADAGQEFTARILALRGLT